MSIELSAPRSEFGAYKRPHTGEWLYEFTLTSAPGHTEVVALTVLSTDASWVNDHFGVMPGVLCIEIAAQLMLCSAATCFKVGELNNLTPRLAGCDSFKLKQSVCPGDLLKVTLTGLRKIMGFWIADATIDLRLLNTNSSSWCRVAEIKGLKGGLFKPKEHDY